MNIKELASLANEQFTKRLSLMILWQEIAENFFPERADFTYNRVLGTDFAAGMMTSYPFICRRDFGDQLGQMLRSDNWFHPAVKGVPMEQLDTDGRQWLEWAGQVQRRAMYDRAAQFERATKLSDHDFVTFGQTPMSIEMNYRDTALLYRNYHLRDVCWTEDDKGEVGSVFRKWKPTAQNLLRLYPATAHRNTIELARKQPYDEVDCLHMVVEADTFDGDLVDPQLRGYGKRGRQPRILICYDTANQTILEATPIWHRHYIIPRWIRPGHTQYAFSPATVAALADARLLQAMTLTLLEAGEKITNPPMVATEQAVRSDIDIAPGGVTWVDIEYDERLGEALRPMTLDAKGMPIGIDMQRDSRLMVSNAFYLNKIAPPLISKDPRMTAFQAGQVVQQWIREALPLFQPIEPEYNGQLCEETFGLLLRNGAFGDPRNIPRSLMGADIDWRFTSPLHDVVEQQKGQKFLEMKQLLAEAVAMDPACQYLPDTLTALRDALNGIGVPARWQHTEDMVEASVRKAQAQQAAEQLLARMQSASQTSANLATAKKDNAQAEAVA